MIGLSVRVRNWFVCQGAEHLKPVSSWGVYNITSQNQYIEVVILQKSSLQEEMFEVKVRMQCDFHLSKSS